MKRITNATTSAFKRRPCPAIVATRPGRIIRHGLVSASRSVDASGDADACPAVDLPPRLLDACAKRSGCATIRSAPRTPTCDWARRFILFHASATRWTWQRSR